MKNLLFTIFLLGTVLLNAQTQTVRGKVVDGETQYPLIGSMIIIKGGALTEEKGVTTDVNGYYKIENIPFGKYTLVISYTGFQTIDIPNVIVDAGKETILDIELEESTVGLGAVEITISSKDETNNQMATVSARTFNVEETKRYAGSRSDPARAASNFAGAQGADDSRNDIVVRGNTPVGVLWRVEGVDIPNPNHFAIAGTNGGSVAIINNTMLAKSDFFTGAFPAEYGNATSGVFDIKFRNGNNEKHEFTGLLGLLGTEFSAEGPFSDSSKASYLVNFRYSTFELFDFAGINIGLDAIPRFMDGSFKLNFPLKNHANISFFGMGGKSNIDIIVSNDTVRSEDLYGLSDRDQLFETNMGVVGATYKKSINKKTLFSATVAATTSEAASRHIKVLRDINYVKTDTFTITRYSVKENRISFNTDLTYKWNSKNSLKSGLSYTHYSYDMFNYEFDVAGVQTTFIDFANQAGLVRGYSQWKYKANKKLVFNIGVNAQLYTLNNSYAVEPRAGLKYKLTNKQDLSFGYGKHSQIQPTYFYFQEFENANGEVGRHNQDLGFTKSDHFVLGYNVAVNKTSRIKTEVYYQNLTNIPVYKDTATGYSMINFGSTYRFAYPPELENTGTGYNYGFEITFEKFFNKSFFLLTTLSIYDSKYKGSDDILRNTAFNSNYTGNLLVGKEWKLGKKKNKTLGIGTKITYAGGKRYTAPDSTASNSAEYLVEDLSRANEQQFKDYFRADLKVSYKVNKKKVTHEFALDIVNVAGIQNVLKKTYIPAIGTEDAQYIDEYQLGFFPIFYYKIDF